MLWSWLCFFFFVGQDPNVPNVTNVASFLALTLVPCSPDFFYLQKNVLDGPCAHTNGLITVMTTQRLDKLMQDERTVTALLRAGRCSKHVHFQMPTKMQINGLFQTMFATYGHKTNASKNKETNEILLVAQEFTKVLKSEEKAYWTRYNTALDKESTNDQKKHVEDKADVGKGTPRCWKATVDWDSIKGYLRPLLSNTEGYQRATIEFG